MRRSDAGNRGSRSRHTPTYLKLVRNTTAPVAPMAAHSTARQRVQIIPLPEPTGPVGLSMPPAVQPITVRAPEASVPRLAPAVSTGGDRRTRRPGRTPEDDAIRRLTCSSCGADARIDVVDLHTHRLHLSCDRCYRMWQDQVRHDDAVPSTRRTSDR